MKEVQKLVELQLKFANTELQNQLISVYSEAFSQAIVL